MKEIIIRVLLLLYSFVIIIMTVLAFENTLFTILNSILLGYFNFYILPNSILGGHDGN